ncbi:MAG TPA: glycosyltransferase family 39 protein, partial [Chitinophagales bacterium]|nr:glycosyltransferase family 39 protein [Chitinophagales bacterium]
MAKHLPKNKSTVAVPPVVATETSSGSTSATTIFASTTPYHWYFFFGLVVLGFLLYVNTLQHGFVLDDPLSISLNTYVQKGWGGIMDILTTNYRAGVEGANSSGSVYRPLSLIMFAIEWSISPNSPFIGHFMNVLLYALTGGIVYLVFYQLLGKKNVWVAFAAALLFVAHPIHTETVANIKSRDEILCLLLFLCSLWAYLRYLANDNKTYLLLAMGAYFLSLLSKENAITMLPVFALLHYHRHTQTRTALVQLGISLLPAILFLAMRQYALTHSAGITTIDKMDNPIIAANSLSTQWATGVFVLGKYVQVLLFPYPLICD